MREIKFRAWDKKYKEMIIDIHIAPEYGWLVLSDNDALAERERPKEGQIILMQYTGLKDKNGKEIYWFDILKYFDEENRKHLLIIGENENIINAYRELEMALYYSAYIVGNKFENPELLEDK